MKNILKPLTKSVLIPLRVTVAVSAADAAIQKEDFGLGMPTLIIPNEEINHILEIKYISPLENLVYWQKNLMKQLNTNQKNKKKDFLGLLLGTLGVGLLWNLWPVKGTIRAGEDTIRAIKMNINLMVFSLK